ncbi:SecA Wing/Scaffold [Dillenia turbinata]|uniref:SecA Wing/Scaffold n=1 Tax=Dillenia turbinata TaxID=194707 RepID=A0AAN8ZHB7_9MAGN
MHNTGWPMLAGTTSVEKSDSLSEQLHEAGIPPEGAAQDEVIAKLHNAFLEIVKEYMVYIKEERKRVVSAGELHVIGSKWHASGRIDNQQLFEYDEVLKSQRDRVYTEQRRALEADNLQSLLIEYAELTMDNILEHSTVFLHLGFGILYCYLLNDLTPELLQDKCSSYEDLQDYLHLCGCKAYLQKEGYCGQTSPRLNDGSREVLILSNIDRLWKNTQALKFEPVLVKKDDEQKRQNEKSEEMTGTFLEDAKLGICFVSHLGLQSAAKIMAWKLTKANY